MKKFITTILFVCALSVCSFGQKKDVALKEYYLDAEFFLAQGYYADALHDYLEVYKRGYSNNASINYKIGLCYLNMPGQKEKSITYLEKAKLSASRKFIESSLNAKYVPIDVFLYLGNAYRVNNLLDKAIGSYKEYKSLLPEDEENLHAFADKQIEACNIASEFMSNQNDVEFRNMGSEINKNTDDYHAVVSGDGSTLLYMHKLPFYDAVYFSKFIDGNWTSPDNITPQIMSDGDQFVSSVSYDGKTLYLTKEDAFNSDIYVSRYINNRWTKSEPLNSEINTKYWESHASISKDGKSLFFASNRKGGLGESDIYVSKIKPDGKWGVAENLGNKINTDLNDDTPFITNDGKSLYFSSQGYVNMGGYDIFVSHNTNGTDWTLPENLGYPINTTDDDLFYYPWENGKSAYISRIEKDGYGGSDIYTIDFKDMPELENISGPITVAIEINPADVIADQEPETAIAQQIVPKDEMTDEEEITTAVIDETKETSGIIDTLKPETKPPPPAVEFKSFALSPVFFDFDRSSLTITGKQEIDRLIILLKEYPELNVEFIGYADALGPAEYNIKLTQQRATTVSNYVSAGGIDQLRLVAIGKGEINFISPNTKPDGSDNPEGRKFNRRVEFDVSGVNKDKLIIKRIDPVPKGLGIQQK